MKQRYRFRFYPTSEQEQTLARTFGACRYVYNWALRLRTDAFARGEYLTYNATSARLTVLKKHPDTLWLNEVSCVPTQQALRHLQVAFKKFFEKRSRYPAFKKKRGTQSAEYTRSAFRWDAGNRNLFIAKLGRLRVRWSRAFTREPTTVTITKSPSGRYHVTLVLDEPVTPLAPTGESVGIDLGVNRLATLSNGERIPNPKHLHAKQERLRRAQRVLSRRQKSSGRWERQRLRVAHVLEKVGDCRRDHLHKVTTDLVRRFDRLAVEDLNVGGMMRNRRLARAISDAGFGMFLQMLAYKCAWYGRELLKADRFFPSSKRCSGCGRVVDSLPLCARQWRCPGCGAFHDRDENAAKNIKAVGHTVSARGGDVSPLPGRPDAAVAVEA